MFLKQLIIFTSLDLDDIINQDIPFNGTELSPNDLRLVQKMKIACAHRKPFTNYSETIIRLRKQLEQHRRGGVSYDMYEALQTDLDNAMRGKRDAERSQRLVCMVALSRNAYAL
jgi:hypothetical protein